MREKKFEWGFNAIQISMLLFFSLIGSAAPVWSFAIFKMQLAILFIGILIAVYWYRAIEDARKYNLFVAADMIVLMGFFAIVPVLRLTFGTIVFWILLVIYLLIMFHSIIKNIVLHRLPASMKFVPSLSLWSAMVLLISVFFFRDSQGAIIATVFRSSDGAIVLSFLLYIIGVFMTWLAFVAIREFFEKPPERKRKSKKKNIK
jgi:hypothetical protein